MNISYKVIEGSAEIVHFLFFLIMPYFDIMYKYFSLETGLFGLLPLAWGV